MASSSAPCPQEVVCLDSEPSPIEQRQSRQNEAGPSSSTQQRAPLGRNRRAWPAPISSKSAGQAASRDVIDLSSAAEDDDDVVVLCVKPGKRARPAVTGAHRDLPAAQRFRFVPSPMPRALLAEQRAPAPAPPSPETKFKCPICLEAMEQMATTPCGHVYCFKCLQDALKVQKKCPKCRKNCTLKQVHRVYLD